MTPSFNYLFVQILIAFALAFFFAVVLYILRKRLFPTFGPLEVIELILAIPPS